MSLANYTDLKASVADWLNRSDLTTQIPDFIALAEAEMSRRIRKWTVYDDGFAVATAVVTAPTDLKSLRSIRLITGSTYLDVPLRLCTIEMLNERKARQGTTGRPTDVAFVDGSFYFAPEPDQSYTAELFYFSTLTPLATTSTNSVLDEAPDAYLAGTLKQAAAFLEHDERVAGWEAMFDKAIDQLNADREDAEYTASVRDVRLPRTFG